MKKTILSLLSLALVAGFSCAQAGVIMDQIGNDPTVFNGAVGDSSQQFESSFSTYDIAVIDDFNAAAGMLNINNVQALFQGGNGFTSFANVQGYYVQVYSSIAAAAANETGDIASAFVSGANVTLTQNYVPADTVNGIPNALVSLSLNINLSSAGTYYIAVQPRNDFSTNGQTYLYMTPGTVAGANPGGVNAYQTNPGGAFGFPGNQMALGLDAAYRINAVPEPSTWAALLLGGCVLLIVARARRASQS
ncbi:MAG TPA: PEP-CTERM sorting domain-containing protein [Chthoniobacterales bacterium]